MSDTSTPVAVYERTTHASLERIWENVMDWEHLPWLHRSTFLDIALQDRGTWGWRARVGFPPAETRSESVIELVRRADECRYVARTLEGPGKGSEIWTSLDPRARDRTRIRVEFHVPGLSPEHADSVGDVLKRSYARLWDEDEAMMVHREAGLARRPPDPDALQATVELGSLPELRRRLPLQLELEAGRFQVLEIDGEVIAHSSVCPHMLGPLDAGQLEGGRLRCPWHGYVFDLRSGDRCGGSSLRLAAAPEVVVDPSSASVHLVFRAPAADERLSERSGRRSRPGSVL